MVNKIMNSKIIFSTAGFRERGSQDFAVNGFAIKIF